MHAERGNASLMVDRVVESGRGERTAYVGDGEPLSYEQLRRQVNRMGRLLGELGVRREQRIVLVLDNTTVFPIAFLGALRIGAVPVPVSVRETAENFRHFVEDSYAGTVVCDAQVLGTLQAALAGFDVTYLARGAPEGAIELDGALAAQDHELAAVPTHPDDMAFWLYTSGSTGKPKGVVHVHGSIAVTCESFGRQVLEITEEDRIFSTTKLYHAYGLGNSLSFPLYFGASAVLCAGPPTPEQLLSTLAAHPPTVYCSVPALYRQLLDDPDAERAFDSVRLCISAAEPLPLKTFEGWRERFGLEILDGIGSTEMLQCYCSNRPGEVVAGTTGRPVPGYEMRLIDESGAELQGPGIGALEVKGDSCAAYYWHQRGKTRRSMRGEWFASGDRFCRRADGTYEYVGRVDEMVKVGGLWVSPVDVEQALLEHPAVDSAGAVGVSIDDYSRVAAFVSCREGVAGDEQLEDSLRTWCRERLRDHEYPHLIRFLPELPRTLTGKPQRYKLREMIAAEPAPAPVEPNDAAPGSFAGALSALAEEDRDIASLEMVRRHVASVLGCSAAELSDPQRSFKELGFDSLAAVELRNRLTRALGLRLPSTLIFDHPTPLDVAAVVRERAEEADRDGPDPSTGAGEREEQSELEEALETIRRHSVAPPMPPASLAIRLRTSPWTRAVMPTRLLVDRAARRAQAIWERSPGERQSAVSAMETIVAGTERADDLEELGRLHLIERQVDRALFWQRRWPAKVDEEGRARLEQAISSGRGLLLSACHLGPHYRLPSVPPLADLDTYLVPGPWFFEAPSHDLWGRRLARWRKGLRSRPVLSTGSFPIVQALLERGDPVFLYFDMPGNRPTRFLGKPAMLANGTAHLAVKADALVLPLRARRAGHEVWVEVGAALDPRDWPGAEELHDALAAFHERWILEDPAAMEDPRTIGWGEGASAEAWVAP